MALAIGGWTRRLGLLGLCFPCVLLQAAEQVDGPWRATLPYFAPADIGQDKAQITAKVRDRFRLQGSCDCRILIATVPDPVNSRLGLFFDRSIESIQRAAEDSAWEFDRTWMPWSDRVTVETSGPDKYYSQRALLEARQQQPGILVFRARPGARGPKLLLVLLVAETPVGISPVQFQNALDDAAVLSASDQIEILGPTFSGSFPSLQRLLKQHWAFSGKTFRIRSGTATSLPYAESLISALGAGKSTFHSAVNDSGSVLALLDSRLGDLNTDHAHTALLVEDESVFGSTIVSMLPTERSGNSILTIRFPREISAVRNAYQEAVQTTPNAKEPAPAQQQLAFSLRDPQTGEDSVPIFAKAHTPLAQNAVLSEIATTLKRDHIRLAEIVATNVLDTLFLIRVLRAACPDVRLLVPSADLLFVQAEMEEPMAGTLVLSNYPLFWPNQKWTENPDLPVGRVVFSDSNSQGVYNAARILLQPDEKVKGLREYLSPLPGHGPENHPPLWLLEVTGSGLWPIRVFDQPRAPQKSNWFQDVTGPKTLPGLAVEPPSRIWSTITLLAALTGLGFSLAVWVAQRPFAPRPLYILALSESDRSVPIRALYLLTLCFCITVLLVVLGVPSLQFISPIDPLATTGGIQFLLLISLLSLFLMAVFTLRRLRSLESKLIAASAVLVGTSMCALVVASCTAAADGAGSFFAFRSLHPSNGCSPVVPAGALLVGCGLFVWAHLKRTVFAVERKPLLPTSHFDEYAFIHLGWAQRRLNKSLESFFPAPIHTIGGTVVLASILVLIEPGRFLFVIEPAPFRVILVTLFIVLLTFVLGTSLRFVLSWSRLKELLTRVDRLRLGGAFRRLPRQYSGEPIWQQQIRLRTYATMSRGAECLDILSALGENALRTGGIDPMILEAHRANLRNAINAIFTAESSGRSESFREAQTAREIADDCANYFSGAVLVPAWQRGVVDADLESGDTDSAAARSSLDSKEAETPVYRLASEFVSLRFASYIRYALLQLRNLLGFISAGFAFLAATLVTYPFQAPQTIRWVLSAVFLAISIPSVLILTQMSKNPVLRRLASQKSGGVDTGLLRRLAYFGSLPLLGVLSAQFPAMSRWIGSWLQPTLEALR